ncbi:hypothetical protein NDU88_005079 [Pleurodeles waltl]|uniref:Uncharacterized protein n=1 Tax=Pleurodeles waltl TaxID=8319 RepID=A0AAV7SKT7_PLEWA|nr:hypothetical protein NDU88_005079 [Pleurodeles waltl]
MPLTELTRLPFPGEETRCEGFVPRTKTNASQGTCFPLPGREDASLWLRVQFLVRLPFPRRRDAPSVARKRRCVTMATRTVPCASRAQETVREAVVRLAHKKGERNRDQKGKKKSTRLNKCSPARDTNRALHSSPAQDTKRGCTSPRKPAEVPARQNSTTAGCNLQSTSAAASPGLHYTGSQIQNHQARSHRWADPDEE